MTASPAIADRRSSRRSIAALGAFAIGLTALAGAAGAHEYGPFAVDRHAAILVSPDRIELDYVLELAETPTRQQGDDIDADVAAYCSGLLDKINVSVDAIPLELRPTTPSAVRSPGDGGLDTMRLECGWTASLDLTDAMRSLRFDDGNFVERVGWREIVVVGDRTQIVGDVSDTSVSKRLTDDSTEADDNPDRAAVTIDFAAADSVGPADLDRRVPGDDDLPSDPLTNLIADAEGGIVAMSVALLIASVLGAMHSLAPGHGKTVIGAYLIGTRGTRIQAFVLAIAVALSHTLGVFVLGGITVAAGAAFAPESVYPWLQAVSAVIVLGIGIWLVLTAYNEWRSHAAASPDHDHDHDHDHDQARALAGHAVHEHAVHSGHDHSGHDHSGHDHSHGDHDHGDHDHGDHSHDDHGGHDHGGVHRHGIFPHVHRYDLNQLDLTGKVSWKTLAVLGLSGGLVPSTSAIIVLLGAIQLNRLLFGGFLILAFGIGMAVALVSVGLGMVALSNRTVGLMEGNVLVRRARLLLVPLAATAVLCVGVFLSIRAFANLS